MGRPVLNNDKVALVSMPFASIDMPSIGISLLQAELRRDGIECHIHYPNLRFARHIGIPIYSWLANPAEVTLTGEWIFAHLLFPDRAPSMEAYLKDILLDRLRGEIDLPILGALLKARSEASQFLNDCLEAIDFSQYRIVGFTSTFEQNLASLALARRLKEKYPGVVIVFGGANCEAEMGIELHRQFGFVDYVCSGEGDVNFPELVQRILRGQSVCGLDGIIARCNGETVVPPQLVAPVSDLDALPIPAYDDYFDQLRSYELAGKIEPHIPLETARGCWWGAKMHCTFCGLNGSTMSFRSKSPDRVFQEISMLAQKYGTKFAVVDNILNLQYLDSLFPRIISSQLKCTFFFETKVNLKKRQLQLLSAAGVTALQPGIESLSTPILRSMKKGCTLLQNLQFLKWAKQYGIKASWNLLYGFPGEDPEEYCKMARLIPSLHHLQPPEACPRISVVRFSPYFTRWQDYGLGSPRADRAYSYIYQVPRAALDNLAYVFEFDHPLAKSVDSYAQECLEAVGAWQSSAAAATLTMRESGSDLLLLDRRKPGPAQQIALHEPLSSIYRLCDEALALSQILQAIPAPHQITGEEVETALDSLVEKGLMAKEGSSYLSLAIPAPEMFTEKPGAQLVCNGDERQRSESLTTISQECR
jgi:ribosomal peptide maturation radical SAM protein 1